LFSRGCKLMSLRVVPCQVTAKASAPDDCGIAFSFVCLTLMC
jgi:hypothetical protein